MAKSMQNPHMDLYQFFFSGKAQAEKPGDVGARIPALLSRYLDLSRIRHDEPVVLTQEKAGPWIMPLRTVLNRAVQYAPSGLAGERDRRHALALERHVKKTLSEKGTCDLSETLNQAVEHMVEKAASEEERDTLKSHFILLIKAIKVQGKLLKGDELASQALLTHVWLQAQVHSPQRAMLQKLILDLNELLDAEYQKSREALSPASLKERMGAGFEEDFDYDVMARMLDSRPAPGIMDAARQQRIRDILNDLNDPRFVEPLPVVNHIAQAHEQLPELRAAAVKRARAVRMARLELMNQYAPARHDAFFQAFSEAGMHRDDWSLAPSLLVLQSAQTMTEADRASLLDLLAAPYPVKVGVIFDSLCQKDESGPNLNSRALSLARMVALMHGPFVLQATHALLPRMAKQLARGMSSPRAACFSIYQGQPRAQGYCPAFLDASCAHEARVFPAFSFDPDAGPDWRSRMDIATNPALEQAWTKHEFFYETRDLERKAENTAFTAADFLTLQPEFQDAFQSVPQPMDGDLLTSVDGWLRDAGSNPVQLPAIWTATPEGSLHRMVCSQPVMRMAQQVQESWHSLQELGGVGNSHAQALLAREKEAWQQEMQAQLDQLKNELKAKHGRTAAAAPVADLGKPQAEVSEVVPEQRDEAFIETSRCTSCNECTNKNPKLFTYDENKQASISDVKAGSFADLVEAAEKCPVCIIHPGKPWNPEEANLEDLIQRAAAFN